MTLPPEPPPSSPSDGIRVTYPHPWLLVVTITFGHIVALASSIGLINLLMPRMMAELSADVRSIQWVQTTFLLTMVVLLPGVGWLGATVGQKRLYLSSLGLFSVSTILCTLAWNLPSMIVFRIVQGIGAGLFFPMGTPLIFDAFPPGRRGVVLGVNVLILMIGSLSGSVLASHLADLFGWRWGFYYLAVLALVGLGLATFVLRERPVPHPGRFDLAGCLSLAGALISFILLITREDRSSYLSGYPLALICICGVSIVVFFAIETRIAHPFVDLHIYRNVAYAAGSLIGFFIPATTVAVSFLLPIFLQRLLGYSIFQTALIRLPSGLAGTVFTPLSGWLSDRLDARLLLGVGTVGFAVSLYTLSDLSLYTSATTLAITLACLSVSSAFIFTPMSNVMFSSLPHESIRLGSGLYAVKRQLGRSVGSAAISVFFTHRLAIQTAGLAENIPEPSTTLRWHLGVLSSKLADYRVPNPDAFSKRILFDSVMEEATVAAFGDCYFIIAIAFTLILIPIWFIRSPKPPV